MWVLDSRRFPATQAELCLQFHDDNVAISPPYSAAYHALQVTLEQNGRLLPTKCPPNYVC